ncbi:uncharacterized protein [Littorina saxatilis]|uniref:SEFIR domain-containing protein n=1 Tax=Littorina saxatilis TaxID=31220 RepID=A0AAN9BW83_9CAEN
MDNTRNAVRMNPSVFVLIVVLQLTESSQNCSTLEVFDSEGKKENVSCRQHEGSACHNGPRAGFPDNLSVGDSVAKPPDFAATPFRRNTTANENMGLQFKWKVPTDSVSRAKLKGFYLKMQLVGSGQVICRLFDLRDFNMTTSKSDASLKFSYELFPVTTFGNYVVDLFSLPPPTDEEHDAGLSETLDVSVQLPRNTRSNIATPPVKTSEGIPPTTSPFLTSAVSNTVQAENTNSDVILPAVLIPEAFLVVAALLMAIYCWKKPKKIGKTCKKNDQHDDDKSQFREVFRKMETFVHRTTRVPQVTRKTVLLLASEDHKYFSQALNNFSTFLTLHCQCDVMFAPEQLADVRKTANSYCWLSGKIDQADVVIIVTSEAACRLYQAFQNGMVYKEADLGPEGDLFTPGIKHICGKIASGEDVSKVMMVRFGHTLTDHRLPISALSPCFYLLPDRLKSFLLHMHELDENSMNLSKVNLPLRQGNVKELQGGREWLAAVSESRAFERQHPAWFEEKFRTPFDMSDKGKPTFRTQFSVRSQESGFFDGINPDILHRRLSSVSIIAEEALSDFVPDGLDNPSFVFSKSDFIAPSEVEVHSAYTVTFSDCTEAESPSEVDQGSTLSDQFRMVNERYKQDRMRELFRQQELESMPPGEKSAVSDSTDCPHECQDPANPQQDVYSVEIHGPESWRGLDRISVSSRGWI